MTDRPQSGDAGFTLVELLVALFVFALIASASMAFLYQTIDSREVLEARSRELDALRMAHTLLKTDLLQLADRPTRGQYGEPASPAFSGGISRQSDAFLTLVRRGAVNPGAYANRSTLQHVRYLFEGGQLIREVRAHLDPTVDTRTDRRILLSNLADLEIRFLVDGHWQAGLPTYGLPAAVALTTVDRRFGTVERLFLLGGQVRS